MAHPVVFIIVLAWRRSGLFISFIALFPNRITIYSKSAARVLLVLSSLRNPSASAGEFEQLIVPVFVSCVVC